MPAEAQTPKFVGGAPGPTGIGVRSEFGKSGAPGAPDLGADRGLPCPERWPWPVVEPRTATRDRVGSGRGRRNRMDLRELTREYFAALERGVTGDALAALYHPDVVQEEYPNRLLPGGARR